MKKILFYALAFSVALGAGCSKDVDSEVVEGKYTLPAITASLDDTDAIESRTGLGTNQVVNWSNNDRIAVINTATNTKVQYVLVSGAGTPIGKFEPVNTAATFTNISEIKAVYPAVAATVTGGKISVSLNKEYTEAERVACGITSWTANSSAYAFTNNDIKVSYNTTMTTTGSSAAVNFKFRQLATWCNFVFNFTGNETFAMEAMNKFTLTTTGGSKFISGTAEIDFTDPNKPTLKNGTEKTIEWETTGALSSSTLTKSLMLFPVIAGSENGTQTGDQLKLTIETDLHKFTFYATPSTSLSAGTVLRFPFNVDDNFTMQSTPSTDDFSYAVVDGANVPPAFYYYGTYNCILLGTTETGKSNIDVAPHKTNTYYWVGGDNATVPTTVPKANYAEVIWREATMTAITVSCTNSKLSISGVAGTGNALVGIYDNNSASKKLLWSYHVWKPEIDVTATLPYKYTNSGTYNVMPIALGATAKATVASNGTATDATNTKSFGMYYQWGRKDPLGRPSAITAGAEAMTMVYAGATGTTEYKLSDASHEINLSTLLGGDNVTEKDGVKTGVYMLNYVTSNPTNFIVVPDGKYNNDWYGPVMNDNLWGNPTGYNYPRMAQTHRSVFDPCPEGWRVAPKDLWIAFTDNGGNRSVNAATEATWAGAILNVLNISTDTKSTTMATQRGYHFCYETNADGTKKWQTGATDFYPASGLRNRISGALASVGSYGYCWSSSPYSSGSAYAGYLDFGATAVNPLLSSYRASGFPVRCVRE